MVGKHEVTIGVDSFDVSITPLSKTRTRWSVTFHEASLSSREHDETIRMNAKTEDAALKAAIPRFRAKLSAKKHFIEKAVHTPSPI